MTAQSVQVWVKKKLAQSQSPLFLHAVRFAVDISKEGLQNPFGHSAMQLKRVHQKTTTCCSVSVASRCEWGFAEFP